MESSEPPLNILQRVGTFLVDATEEFARTQGPRVTQQETREEFKRLHGTDVEDWPDATGTPAEYACWIGALVGLQMFEALKVASGAQPAEAALLRAFEEVRATLSLPSS